MANTLKGEQIKLAILTENAVRAIRREREVGATISELARKYGVGRTQVFRVIHRTSWRHVA